MLVLARNLGEKIRILAPDGTEVWLTVVDIGRGKVRFGIEAPRNWQVHRQELLPLEPPGKEGGS